MILVSQITEIEEIDGADIPMTFPLKTIRGIGEEGEKKEVSLVAIVFDVETPCEEFQNQDAVLVDDSLRCVTITLWGDHVNKLSDKEGTCIVFEGVTTRKYDGKLALKTSSYSRMLTMDDIVSPRQLQLQDWWDKADEHGKFDELVLDSE